MKILFADFLKVLSFDVGLNACYEIAFKIDGDSKYDYCWMGKMAEDSKSPQPIYWYGLVDDGSEAYDYRSADEFINARIFHGKCIKELYEAMTILSIDSCDPEERLPYYLGLEDGPAMGRPVSPR